MKYRDIYPYQNRSLNMSGVKTPREDASCIKRLSEILLANLVNGETLRFPKGHIIVVAIDDDRLSVDFHSNNSKENPVRWDIQSQNVKGSMLFSACEKILEVNAYHHDCAKVLERDPAVFRRQDKKGWVISDALCMMSGNVTCQASSDTREDSQNKSIRHDESGQIAMAI